MAAASLPDRGRSHARARAGLLIAALVFVGSAAAAQACTGDQELSSSSDAATNLDVAASAEAGPETLAPRGRDKLSQAGLYADISRKIVTEDALAFQPAFVLWSDGAEKKRWVRLPPGTTIDTSDPDHWVLPVGAQLFKEFSRDGKRLETRLVERVGATGNREKDYWLGAFLWRDDESDADFVKDGAANVRGTTHDVPSAETCWACHIGEPGHALGFSALQLSHELGGLNLGALRARGLVPATLADKSVPGDAITRDAVGWLHANCGHCHNQNGASWPDTDMVLRFGYGESAVTSSPLYTSTVGVPTRSFKSFAFRIEPGDPDASAVAHRIATRQDGGAMPPIATEIVDPAGVQRVRSWIATLPPRDAGAD